MAGTEQNTATTAEDSQTAAHQLSNPTSKYSGNGVLFKAKLFGTADVNEPRGDNVCNTAIGLLKAAVKNTGEHKQKILVRINFGGITLLDAFNQLKLYDHPVNKISFIAKDPNDARAFGYIVTETDGKHTYFGIRTEKAADPVVMALRDMFQEVFDLKKKEAEGKTETAKVSASPPAAPEGKAVESAATSSPTTEPKLGDEDNASKAKSSQAAERENSSSHLLELLGDLSFVEPTQQTAPAQGQGQPWPPQSSASWGNAVPAQNDPFAVQQNAFTPQQPQAASFTPQQQQPVSFTPQQPQAVSFTPQQQAVSFTPQQQAVSFTPQQQAAAQARFTQPSVQSPFSPPTQPLFGNQPQMFGASGQPAVFQQPAMYQPQAAPAAAQSPFAQQQPQPAAFPVDPFATNGLQQPAAQPTAAATTGNPFASGGEAFGVLQPQPMAQPAAAAAPFGQPQGQAVNLFSDLNPIPGSSQQVRKDQFFSDVKNPPKPKLNEMPQKTQAAEPATNNNVPW